MIRDFQGALSLLTIVPVRWPAHEPALPANAARWFPLVGAFIGSAVAGVLLLPLPALPRAALALGVWILSSGALHEDGVMDCADAAFAPVAQDKRIAVRKDPRVGAFAVSAAGILLLARFAALAVVPVHAALLAPTVGRWCMSCTLALPAPTSAASLSAALTRPRLPVFATVLALLLVTALSWALHDLRVVSASAWGLSAGIFTGLLLVRRLGELSGDVHGAAGIVAETITLYALLPISR